MIKYNPNPEYPTKPYLMEFGGKSLRFGPDAMDKLQREIDASKLDAYYNIQYGETSEKLIYQCPRCKLGVGFHNKEGQIVMATNCRTCGYFLIPDVDKIINDVAKNIKARVMEGRDLWKWPANKR